MRELSDDVLVDLALGLRNDPETRQAVQNSRELQARLRRLQTELKCLDEDLDGFLAGAGSATALPESGWHILLPIDDSNGGRRAAAAAELLAQLVEGEVEVLHVREVARGKVGPLLPETSDEASELVAGVVAQLREVGVDARGAIRTVAAGQVAPCILAEAEAGQMSLIVMGSRPMSAIAAALFGSVSRAVLRHAACPVLIVR